MENHLSISTITIAELEYGVANSSNVLTNSIALAEFIGSIDEVLNFDMDAAKYYGKLKAELVSSSIYNVKNENDIKIAAQAISRGYNLVTDNENDFSKMSNFGLHFENWRK